MKLLLTSIFYGAILLVIIGVLQQVNGLPQNQELTQEFLDGILNGTTVMIDSTLIGETLKELDGVVLL